MWLASSQLPKPSNSGGSLPDSANEWMRLFLPLRDFLHRGHIEQAYEHVIAQLPTLRTDIARVLCLCAMTAVLCTLKAHTSASVQTLPVSDLPAAALSPVCASSDRRYYLCWTVLRSVLCTHRRDKPGSSRRDQGSRRDPDGDRGVHGARPRLDGLCVRGSVRGAVRDGRRVLHVAHHPYRGGDPALAGQDRSGSTFRAFFCCPCCAHRVHATVLQAAEKGEHCHTLLHLRSLMKVVRAQGVPHVHGPLVGCVIGPRRSQPSIASFNTCVAGFPCCRPCRRCGTRRSERWPTPLQTLPPRSSLTACTCEARVRKLFLFHAYLPRVLRLGSELVRWLAHLLRLITATFPFTAPACLRAEGWHALITDQPAEAQRLLNQRCRVIPPAVTAR